MGYKVGVGDINTAYLNASTREKIWTKADQSFVKNGYALLVGDPGMVTKAQYGLPTSGHEWWIMLADTLREMGFSRSRGDPDVWIRPNGDSYDYIGTYTDDMIVVSHRVQEIFDEINAVYNLGQPEEPSYHIGVDYFKTKLPCGSVKYELGSKTYVGPLTTWRYCSTTLCPGSRLG